MRLIVDTKVKKLYEGSIFGSREFNELAAQYPGKTQAYNKFEFIKQSQITPNTLLEEMQSEMQKCNKGSDLDSYCLMLLKMMGTSSVYISVAAQYCLYEATTRVVNVENSKEFVERFDKAGELNDIDMSMLERVIKQMMSLKPKAGSKESDDESNEGNLFTFAEAIK